MGIRGERNEMMDAECWPHAGTKRIRMCIIVWRSWWPLGVALTTSTAQFWQSRIGKSKQVEQWIRRQSESEPFEGHQWDHQLGDCNFEGLLETIQLLDFKFESSRIIQWEIQGFWSLSLSHWIIVPFAHFEWIIIKWLSHGQLFIIWRKWRIQCSRTLWGGEKQLSQFRKCLSLSHSAPVIVSIHIVSILVNSRQQFFSSELKPHPMTPQAVPKVPIWGKH